jgi:hypothetical protein
VAAGDGAGESVGAATGGGPAGEGAGVTVSVSAPGWSNATWSTGPAARIATATAPPRRNGDASKVTVRLPESIVAAFCAWWQS